MALALELRGHLYSDRLSYIVARRDKSPNTVIPHSRSGRRGLDQQDGQTVIHSNGYPEGNVKIEAYNQPDHLEKPLEISHLQVRVRLI